MKKLLFLPRPEGIRYTGQSFFMPEVWSICIPAYLEGMIAALGSLWPELELTASAGYITFSYEEGRPEESYRLEINSHGIVIGSGSVQGAFYALVTLHQAVLQSTGEIPCCVIEDHPGLKIRGALLDISRGKVPTLQTLKKTADLLASFKYNHLELYIEGFSYGYPSFADRLNKDSCILPEEMKEFCIYCQERFIELAPHQNSLGHMAYWLSLPEYKKLAEAEEGLSVMGMRFPPSTLDAADPGSLELVERLIGDLAPSFHAKWFHAGLDEAFEFGKGKNRAFVEKNGGAARILPYVESIHDKLKEQGFRMMMWDDLLAAYPELARRLPEDILMMNWGYDGEYPVERRAEVLKASGRKFCLSPGTSSWSSFTGLTDNMLENIRRTGQAACRYGAEGLVVTDWGDMNHLQYLPVSYPGLVFAAAWAWNKEGAKKEELASALDIFIFRDASGRMGNFCLEAGRFYRKEEFRLPCRSLACLPLLFGKLPAAVFEEKVKRLAESVTFFSPDEVSSEYLESYRRRKEFDGAGMYDFLENRLEELKTIALPGEEGALIRREYRNALKMLQYLTGIREQIRKGSLHSRYESLLTELIREHRNLWMERNKKSGLEEGIRMFEKISMQQLT